MKHVAIIGAGPSGLVALKTLLETGRYTATLYESTEVIGGTFAHKTYDDGALVSSRLLTAFSDFRFKGKAAAKDHPTIPEYLEYLQQYADYFKLWEHISFNSPVSIVRRNASTGRYNITVNVIATSVAVQVQADAVCICSGLHNIPNLPTISSFEKFQGQSLHSSQYKERAMFEGKRVLVVGAGETGCDIAYRAAIAHAKSVLLSARSGFLSVPHEWYDGAPLDSFITNLFECSYQHRWLEYFKIKWRFTTPFIRLGFLLGSGSSSGWNQWALTKTTTVARGHHIINKSVRCMPYINRPLKRTSFLGRWLYSDGDNIDANAPDIDTTYATPTKVLGKKSKTIEMSNGDVHDFDLVVFCTGYKQYFPFLPNNNGGQDIDDPLPDVHNIVSQEDPYLSYIGFVRPNVGAIPPMSEIQIMWWIQHMEGQLQCKCSPTYHLMGDNKRTGSYAVDYGAYCSDLAREIGCLPSLTYWIWKSPKIFLGYSLGQSYATYFRLEGPFQCDEAQEIAEDELWEPVWKRPLVTNVLFVSIILFFGVLNGCCVVIETLGNILLMPF